MQGNEAFVITAYTVGIIQQTAGMTATANVAGTLSTANHYVLVLTTLILTNLKTNLTRLLTTRVVAGVTGVAVVNFNLGGRGAPSQRDNNNLALNPDMSSTAIADTECFMEIGCGYVNLAGSNEYRKVRFLFDSQTDCRIIL